jgi:hypothetical protein
MNDEHEVEWKTIDGRRNIMLSQSDWTQLIDAELTRTCVAAWRTWRRKVRDVSAGKHPNRLGATAELRHLRDNRPSIESVEYDEILVEQSDVPLSIFDLKNTIKEVILELDEATQAHVEPPVAYLIEVATDMVIARSIARKAVNIRYHANMESCSPAPEMQTVYNERLNQAVDLLSEVSEVVPLLEVMAEALDETVTTVAMSVLNKHRHTINDMCDVEVHYLQILKKIQESVTVTDLKEIVAQYGH